jgi:hypothetical protein
MLILKVKNELDQFKNMRNKYILAILFINSNVIIIKIIYIY